MSVCGHLGFYNTSSTRTHVRLQFPTFAASGSSVAPNSAYEAADIRIYRAADGAAFSATQRSSANGITMTSPFDSLVGFHDVDIDLTDNTDAGFYAAGYFYSVVLAADETVDSQTINGVVLCTFEIGVAPVNVTQYGGSAGTFSGGRPEVNATHWGGTAVASANVLIDGAITAAKIAADAITSAKIATDAITSTQLAGSAVSEIQSGLALAADLATLAGYVDTEVAAIKAKTDNLPSDPADASDIAASFTSLASTLTTIASYIDTEVLAIKAKTDNLPADPADASDIAAEFATVNSTLATLAGYVDTEVAAIKAKTDNLPTDPADQSAVEAAITSAQSALTTLINAVDDFVDTEVAAIKVVSDKLNSMLQTSGANYQFTTDALENAPAGGGGGGDTFILAPVFSEFVPRVREFNATLYVGDTAPVTLVLYTVDPETGTRTATDLTPFASLYLRIEDPRHGEVQTVENADLTIDGSGNNELTFSPSAATVSSERQLKAALRTDDTEDQVVAIGTFTIKYAPRAA